MARKNLQASSPNRKILKPHAAHQRGVVEVAAIEDHRGFQHGFEGVEVGATELAPLGDDDQGVCIFKCSGLDVGISQAGFIGETALGLVHGNGVVSGHGGTCGQQVGNHIAAGGFAHGLGASAQLLGQVGQLVHEADARGRHGVGGVLGEFGTANVHDDQAVVAALNRGVEVAHDELGLRVITAHHNAVGAHEVINGRTFFQKFGVADHAKGRADTALGQLIGNGSLDPVGCA